MVVRCEEVSVRFGRRWALVRLSAELKAAESILLTGENGAGKTTFLRVLSTALRPTRGKLELFGLDAWENLEQVRPRLGLLTHDNHLYFDMSALENLELVARLTGRSTEGLDDLLERVGLGPHKHRRARFFSAGMKRRLCFARLLLRNVEVALLDEPFGQLDPQGVVFVEDVIRELRKRGTTVVMSTHDVPRGKALCDRHLKLTQGRKLGTVAELGGEW